MAKILVVAPHPDDESFGCGGTILKHQESGDEIHWLIMTTATGDDRYSEEFTQARQQEIEYVTGLYRFDSVNVLNYKPATMDQIPMSDMIGNVNAIIQNIQPTIVYLPYRGDAHSDHAAVFDAGISCTKSFRNLSVKSVRVYETLSETNFGMNPDINGFRPNYFVDIEKFLDKKIEILKVFASELKEPPFPRNEVAIRALALLRGQVAGTKAAEAFMSLKEVWCD